MRLALSAQVLGIYALLEFFEHGIEVRAVERESDLRAGVASGEDGVGEFEGFETFGALGDHEGGVFGLDGSTESASDAGVTAAAFFDLDVAPGALGGLEGSCGGR